MTEVRVHVVGYPDSDAEERADLAWRLRQELLDRGVDDVSHPSTRPPPGAKGSALEWAQLMISVAGTVPPMLTALQAWRGRHPRAAITLEIEGDKLTLDEASAGEQQQLVEAFLARHGAG